MRMKNIIDHTHKLCWKGGKAISCGNIVHINRPLSKELCAI